MIVERRSADGSNEEKMKHCSEENYSGRCARFSWEIVL